MKSLVIYYSFSDNTKKVAEILSEYLSSRGQSEVIRLKDLNESGNFFVQSGKAIFHQRTSIQTANFDLTAYDLICLGTPVWAFGPAPPVNTYLEQCLGLGNKTAVLFTTYGSGTGNRRCLNYMQEIMAKKGIKSFWRFSVQQFKVKDKDFVLSKIQESLRL